MNSNYPSLKVCVLCFIFCTGLAARLQAASVSFDSEFESVSEDNVAPIDIRVSRDSTAGELDVHYTVDAGTVFDIKSPFQPTRFAFIGKDFETLSEHVHFADGQNAATIRFSALQNYQFRKTRHDRKVTLTLQASPSYSIGKTPATTVTILDDPSPKTLPTDAVFFSKLNYALPALSEVKAAALSGDFAKARRLLAAYFRARTKPALAIDRQPVHVEIANDALHDTYTVQGIKYTFPAGKINWSGAPINDPKSGQPNPNWGWEFNRFQWWPSLIDAYLKNPAGGEAYGKRFAFELQDWIASSPIELEINGLAPAMRWRTLEVGIRLSQTWINAFYLMKDSPVISDDLLIDWLKSFYLHARYLEVNAEFTTNRGAGEADALYAAGLCFPEFQESADWQKLAMQRLDNITDTDVLPDGSYVELSPGYHDLTLGAFEHTLKLAKANNTQVSEKFRSAVMRMFAYLMYACEPNRLVPPLNDSQILYLPIDVRLAAGFRWFPQRTDFQWLSTDGKQGTPPAETSHLFPDAGQAVMRSGWGRSDCYLMMDAGPFGLHGHEDKLSLNVDSYGVKSVIDCGPYDYVETSPYRRYSVSTFGKSAPLIDNLGECRSPVKELSTRHSPVQFLTSPEFDYAAGAYGVDPDEGWGPDRKRPAETRRHIVFIKPDVWIVVDAFKALDSETHTYSALFQCSDDNVETDSATRRVTIRLRAGEFDPQARVTTSTTQPSLTITPIGPSDQTLHIAKGQDKPTISGWRFEKSTKWKLQAIPTARYDAVARGDIQLAYILAAAPADAEPRTPLVSRVATDAGTYGVSVAFADPDKTKIVLIALDGKALRWKGKTYFTPCLVVTAQGEPEWPN